jgi:UDP-N-acetylglucosamine--N-acetylmuramyl-(pentapeptide) pyrophosphoryl-undecaprenol N-acetylglucosamine transferase
VKEGVKGPKVLFATGGSGGHIYPALAIAAGLLEAGVSVEFCGQAGGMEDELVRSAGFVFHGVAAGKLDRQEPDVRELLQSARGCLQALLLLRRARPALVMGFGGFASLPASLAAVLTRTPLVLHEQNAFPGLVPRLLGRFARLVVTSLPEAQQRMRARAFKVIPYPVREERVGRAAARKALGLPETGLVTLVMGGSQGSVALNDAVVAALRAAGAAAPVTLHATGRQHLQDVAEAAAGIPGHEPRDYVDAVLAWSAADLGITRAGTGTLSEAAFHGVPLIMVPLPTAAENHQFHNARAVEEAGAGMLLAQAELPALLEKWQELLEEKRLLRASAAAAARSPAGARDEFVRLLQGMLQEQREHGTALQEKS